MYVSTDNGQSWIDLATFANVSVNRCLKQLKLCFLNSIYLFIIYLSIQAHFMNNYSLQNTKTLILIECI